MTRCCLLHHLFLLLILLSPLTSPCGGAVGEEKGLSLRGRSLLQSNEPTKPNTKLVVDHAGNVFLMLPSGKPSWSFSSGSPIHSSYLPLSAKNNTENATEIISAFVSEDTDNAITADNRYTRWKFQDFFKKMPLVTAHGATLGSETKTAYVVDAIFGRLFYKSTQSSRDNNNINAMVKPTSTEDSVKLLLHITRTDSKLEHFDNTTRKVVWNVTLSNFRAALLCDPVFNSGDELGPEIVTGVYMPMQCGSEIEVCGPEIFISVHRDLLMKNDSASQNHTDSGNIISKPSTRTRESRKLQEQDRLNNTDMFGKVLEWSPLKLSVPLFFLGAVVSVFIKMFSSRGSDFDLKSGPSKKKKNRKSGKDGITNGQREGQSEFELIEGGQMLLGFNNLLNGAADGRKIGKLFVSNKEIAKGSNGTVVFEGVYEGRPVAVKRLVRSHHEVAFKEIQNLIASDQHSNIIRWYGVEYDRDFVYLCLERCTCSLDDLIKTYLEFSMTKVLGNDESNELAAYKLKLDSLEGVIKGNDFWKVGGQPSPLMLKLMRDVVSGLAHLHELGIVHRDLKPQNVLIISKGMALSAKLSDMGISKRLSGGMSSLGHLATGRGSSGWQAPEQLLQGRQTRAVDMFSLGCVLFYSITGGKHPFGDELERDVNIVKNKLDIFLVEHVPEASDLISRLLNPNHDLRPSATEVLLHPMFWNSEMRLSFLRDASDRVELENREADSEILKAMENTAPVAIGGKWDEKLESVFITNIGRYRRYKYDSIRDLLRVIRNKLNHYRELPQEIQDIVGTVPEGFDEYFAVRFPKLLIEVYRVISMHCREEEVLSKYFKCNII